MIVSFPLFLLRLGLYFLAGYLLLFAAVEGSLLALMLAAVVAALTTYLLAGRDARFKAMYDAHWATQQEVKDAVVQVDRLNGAEVLLGFAYARPLALRQGFAGRKEMGHVLILGPSRSGKGLHAMSQLLNWRGSVVAIDIKGEFYNTTSGYRHDVLSQDVYVLNPSTGAPSNQFDPFAERHEAEQLQATAEAILNPEADGSNKAFALRASFALVAMMMVAKEQDVPVLPFVRDCLRMGPQKSLTMLERMSDRAEVRENLVFFLSCLPSEYNWAGFANDKFANNSWVNLISKMKYLMSRGIIEMTSHSDFKATDLLYKPTSLYMVFRESDLKYTVHSFSAVLLALIEAIIKEYDLHPERQFEPIMFIFDEAGRITVPMLDDLMSTVAGRGMTVLVYAQALAQLRKRYTEEGAETIQANAHTKIYFTPKDEDTAKYLSNNGGKYMLEDQRSSKGEENHSDTLGFSARELITVDEALKMPVGKVIISTNELPYIAGYRMEPFVLPGYLKARQFKPPALKVKKVASELAFAEPPLEEGTGGASFQQLTSLGLTLDDAPELPEEETGARSARVVPSSEETELDFE